MGYDVHITRASSWLDSEELPITLEEWLSYIKNDAEMRRDDQATAFVDGKPVLTYENPGLTVWTAWSENEPDGNMAWFDYRDGRIIVKNPDEEILDKMKQIAVALDAKVIGDEDEEY